MRQNKKNMIELKYNSFREVFREIHCRPCKRLVKIDSIYKIHIL